MTPPLKRSFRPSLAWRLCPAAEGRFDAVLSVREAWGYRRHRQLITLRADALRPIFPGQPRNSNTARRLSDG